MWLSALIGVGFLIYGGLRPVGLLGVIFFAAGAWYWSAINWRGQQIELGEDNFRKEEAKASGFVP